MGLNPWDAQQFDLPLPGTTLVVPGRGALGNVLQVVGRRVG